MLNYNKKFISIKSKKCFAIILKKYYIIVNYLFYFFLNYHALNHALKLKIKSHTSTPN